MKRYLLAGLLAVAIPNPGHAEAALPVIGWSVSPGHSTTGSKICTLFGGFGKHSDLAWVADAASPPQHVTLLFDDGDASPRSQIVVSQLTVAASGLKPVSIAGAVRFGQFRTSLDRRTLEPFLRLFEGKRRMTVALDGETPVLVNLNGSAGAAHDMLHCEEVQNIVQVPTAPVHVAERAKHHSSVLATRIPSPAPAPVVNAAPPLPDPAPAAPVLPAPAPAIASAALKPAVAVATDSPVSTPAPGAQLALNDTLLLAKAIEDQFVAIVQDGKASYQNTTDRDLSQGARATRATDLCTLLANDKEVIDWSGTISDLSSNGQAGGVLAVKLADGITVGTMDNPSSDGTETSMIEPASDLLRTISLMRVGERVTFSGHFFPSNADCIVETSPTSNETMTSPHFALKFSAVEEQH